MKTTTPIMNTFKYKYKIKSHKTFSTHLKWIKKTPKVILKLVELKSHQLN